MEYENLEKVIRLFTFTKELYALKYPVVCDIENQVWHKFISDIPTDNEFVQLYCMNRVETEEEGASNTILQITKLSFEKAPSLPPILEGWIEAGWTNYDTPLNFIEQRTLDNQEPNLYNTEYFDSNKQRVSAFDTYKKVRDVWVERQKLLAHIQRLFISLHFRYLDLNRESESIELMLGQGMLSYGAGVKHPILLKRVSIEFDARKNILRIVDTDSMPELNTRLLEGVEPKLNLDEIKKLQDSLQTHQYHPLDNNQTLEFLEEVVSRLHNDKGEYKGSIEESVSKEVVFTITNSPLFFIRKKQGGVIKAIDDIIEQIKENKEIPTPLLRIIDTAVNSTENDVDETDITIEQRLATISGEDINILLSKRANREQLEIAQKIENNSAVLVQGPPGTGKTHTIANLMGHFLAQGKSVLVTSHTSKALSVVKEKMERELQNLSVAVLDSSNRGDMKSSVEGITTYVNAQSKDVLERSIDEIERSRHSIITELNRVRKLIFAIKHKEFETIVYGGESFTPIEAALFVHDNELQLSYIPSSVVVGAPLPITPEEVDFLYKTNELVSEEEESALNSTLPNPSLLPSGEEFKRLIEQEEQIKTHTQTLVDQLSSSLVRVDDIEGRVYYGKTPLLHAAYNPRGIAQLTTTLQTSYIDVSTLKAWEYNAIIDGKRGGGYRERWESLIKKIEETCLCANENALLLFENVVNGNFEVSDETIATLEDMKAHLEKGRNLTLFSFLKPKRWMELYRAISINGHAISTPTDCNVLIESCRLTLKREALKTTWDRLIGNNGGVLFEEFGDTPELVAQQQIGDIKGYITWYHNAFASIKECIKRVMINNTVLEYTESLDERENIQNLLEAIYICLPRYLEIITNTYDKLPEITSKWREIKGLFTEDNLINTPTCRAIKEAVECKDTTLYADCYSEFFALCAKSHYASERNRLIASIKEVAPEWASQIKNRVDIHGSGTAPQSILAAWKWKQLAAAVDEITNTSLGELEQKAVELGEHLREETAQLVVNHAWWHLLDRLNSNPSLLQALAGWVKTVERIGRGTGKNAPALKLEAQALMAQCQKAVPAWIMPISKALETLDPATNKFDVVIIDEASQCDISSLAVVYLAKKLIIVGDDKQVSPSAVGTDENAVQALQKRLIKDVIPNSHLYDMKTSLYDIAKLAAYPSLMLREHFRCVPSIIGYSNRLSYNYGIKPLRDDSMVVVKPATISCRVSEGVRVGKVNEREAKMIVALMLACMERKEYENMSFGAISLLGDEQAAKINRLAAERIPLIQFEQRAILCGNAAHFQGDERDVIFISLVDSNDAETPLRITNEGAGGATRQRYNVAASRAKDQLWVVHSLDCSKDLKDGDMRKGLIEYVADPTSFAEQQQLIERCSDSPFEREVASALVAKGYNVVQQWQVGAYRIDMVALCGEKKIAIECDGERYHSGEEKIHEDMERQAILERLGWLFIRIRGSEYYRDPEKAIERVCNNLDTYQIKPESNVQLLPENTSILKERVINRAEQILLEWEEQEQELIS